VVTGDAPGCSNCQGLACSVVGTLEKVERVTRFTGFTVSAKLKVANPADNERARRLLEKAEEACLITNSLSGKVHLEAAVENGTE
jgi:organic hydroperoxide reductase OsmC/OhrA